MDITYIPMARGFVYLAVVLHWFSRRVLSRRLSITMEATFCVETLEDALARYGKPDVFNTDQGSQFTSAEPWPCCNRQIVPAVDHRFALSNPDLVSASSKTSARQSWRAATSRDRRHRGLPAARTEHIGSAALKLRLPRGNLIGMHVEQFGKLCQCPIALDGGKRHLRLEGRCVIRARSSLHGLS
jgi:hypothetical protein